MRATLGGCLSALPLQLHELHPALLHLLPQPAALLVVVRPFQTADVCVKLRNLLAQLGGRAICHTAVLACVTQGGGTN